MNAVILSCTTLKDHVCSAQEVCHTDYPVVWLDRQYHIEPQQMREQILSALAALPELSFLCDGNILRFMHFETMMFLLCHVAERLTELADEAEQGVAG